MSIPFSDLSTDVVDTNIPTPRAMLTRAEVCALTNLSYPKIWALIRSGHFPRARQVGRMTRWFSDEIAEW